MSHTLVNHKPDFKCSVPGEKDGLECDVGAERFADILALQCERQLHKVLIELQVAIVQMRGVALWLLTNIPAHIHYTHVNVKAAMVSCSNCRPHLFNSCLTTD